MKLKALFALKFKVIEPCTKLISKFKFKFERPSISSLRPPTFRRRTKVVRFKKPFSIRSLGFPRCGRPRTKFRRRRRPAAISSKFRRALRFRCRHRRPRPPPKKPVPKVQIAELLTALFSLRKTKETETETEAEAEAESEDQVMEARSTMSVSERGHGKEPFPSPITPAFLKAIGGADTKKDSSDGLEDDVEDACRGFENYLVEMIVEEGNVKDLVDVEELLYCWRNLKSPVFIDLVCRFYGELCNDLFCPSVDDHASHETP